MPEALREAIEDLQDVSRKYHRQEAVGSPFNPSATLTILLPECCMPEADSVASAGLQLWRSCRKKHTPSASGPTAVWCSQGP